MSIKDDLLKHFDEVDPEKIQIVEGKADLPTLHTLSHLILQIASNFIKRETSNQPSSAEVLGFLVVNLTEVINEQKESHE